MTGQQYEELIYNGEKTGMASCPPIPEDHPGIIEISREELLADERNREALSTACWRNYIGTWEIANDQLFLVDIIGRFKKVEPEPIFADWATGKLIIPRGERLQYVHMGFESVYEEEVHVTIEKGKVIESHVIDNRNREE